MKRENKINHEESVRQRKIIERLRRRLGTINRSYFITTFGCQMNAHDSEKLKGILEGNRIFRSFERGSGRLHSL